MPGFLRDHSWPVVFSIALHGLLVLGFVLAAFLTQHRAPSAVQPLPIDAVVVDAQEFHAAQRALTDRIAQDAARVKAAADAKSAAAAQEQADQQAVADAQATAAANLKAAAEAEAADKASQNKQRAQDDDAAAAEVARRLTAAKKAVEAKQAAEAKRAADTKQAADDKRAVDAQQAADAKHAAEVKHAADDRAKKDREMELRRQMADEERTSAVQSGPLRDRYITLLRNKIQGAWNKPPSAGAGVDCLVAVSQIPGGEVTSVRVTQCNGDAAVRQSIENAVYRSSPLPDPPDPALFERNFVFRFRPNE